VKGIFNDVPIHNFISCRPVPSDQLYVKKADNWINNKVRLADAATSPPHL